MKCIADVHLGNHAFGGGRTLGGVNDRFEEGFRVFLEALREQDTLFILGDLFDKSEPTVGQLGRVAEALAQRTHPTHILLGNHDSNTFAPYDNAIAPLAGTRGVHLHTEPGVVLADNLRVFVCPYPHRLLDQAPAHVDVALAHAGISDSTTPQFLLGEKVLPIDKLLEWQRTHHVKAVLSGDWHQRKVWVDGTEVASTSSLTRGHIAIQVGALVPTGWDNPGFGYGSVWDIHKGASTHAALKTLRGPRFLRTADEAEAKNFVRKCESFGYTPYLKYDGYSEEPLCEHFKSDLKPIGVEAVKTAAVQVRSLSKLEQVVLEQVEKVPDEYKDDVREEVLNSLRGSA